MPEVKKAVILAAGMGSRFLPLSKVISKELWPLVDKAIIDYLLEEVKMAGINQIIFVLGPEQTQLSSYLKRDISLEKILEKRKKEEALSELKKLQELQKDLSISTVIQKKPLGDGHAVLQAKKKIGKEPFALLFCDDVVESRVPAILQLLKVFQTSQRPVVALARVPKEEVPKFGVVEVEKIAKRFFKIKDIVEKPSLEKAPSDLVVVGKYILTPEIFDYLENTQSIKKSGNIIKKTGEIILAEALASALGAGKAIYGYEIEGRWLGCGDKINWLKSHLYLCLKHPEFGPELKKFLKETF